MTAARRARRLGLVLLAAVLAGGCTYYPTIRDIGGLRIRPADGRLVRGGTALDFYVVLYSTAGFGDTILGAELPGARKAQLVDAAGAPVTAIEVPGATVLRLQAGGPHVTFSDVQRTLAAGDVVLVTLFFQKYGAMGVVALVQ